MSDNFITLEQYRAMIERNILTEPAMLVKNQTQPLGRIIFQALGDNMQMKDIIVPDSRNAIDLTQQAPLSNLLASSQLKSLIQLRRLVILNPDDMPAPEQGIKKPTLSQEPVAGATSIDGTTIPNATVIVEQNGNVWTGTSNGSGAFTVDVSGLAEGPFSVTVTADNYAPSRFTYTAGPQPLQPYPEPTIHAVFKETQVTGTTVADANIVVEFGGKSFTGQATNAGDFTVPTGALPFDTIVVKFVAEGYLDAQRSVNTSSVPGTATISDLKYLVTEINGTASPSAQVEVLVDGQSNQIVNANTDGLWTATVQPVKGDVNIRSLEVSGYDEATATVKPTTNTMGAITIDNADQFGENETVVTGTVAGLDENATDVAVTVTVQAGVYEGTVNLSNGTFRVEGIDAKAGVGSSGVVDITSAFYEEASESFTILEEFSVPTVTQAQDGDTSIKGQTSGSTTVKITMGSETKQASATPQGDFEVTGFTNVAPGALTIELSKSGYLTKTSQVTLVVQAYGIADAEPKVDDTTVTGHATQGSTVTITQGSVTGDAQADASTGEFSVTLSGPLTAGELQFKVSHANYVDYTETLTVAASA
ncbi:hypothetical protein pEaSNUABM25_00225 [Erwinia phage pEa_SNUABM_25]|nr:hypothetical protein pEaSNUABM25_00225 [Erwinia phage pEa_SNUABM_25]